MRGVKQYLKPDAYKQWEPISSPGSAPLAEGEPIDEEVTAYLLYNGSATYFYWQG